MMGDKSQRTLRVEARRAARDAQTKRHEAARARDQRIVDLATTVIANLDERDQVVERTERRAGEALGALVDTEGLSVRSATQACGTRLDEREAARLRRHAQTAEALPPTASSSGPVLDAAPPRV